MLSQKLEVKLKQEQKLTQKLIQKLELIPLNSTELDNLIENEQMINDFIEVTPKENISENRKDDNEEIEPGLDIEKEVLYSQNDWESLKKSKRKKFEGKTSFLENIPEKSEKDFRDYLKDEIIIYDFSEIEKEIADYIIEMLDSKGYLKYYPEVLAQLLTKRGDVLKEKEEEVKKIIKIIQNIGRGGFATFDLKEYFIFQYNQKKLKNTVLKKIIEEHIENFSKNKIKVIINKLNINYERLQEEIKYIKNNFYPYPAWGFADKEVEYIKPDATICEDGTIIIHGKYKKINIMNEKDFENYLNKVKDKKSRNFLKKQYEKAKELASNFNSRNQLLENILKIVYERQNNFFRGGSLKALTQTEVAHTLNVHVSTISRGVNRKYVRIPSGIMEIADFFVNISTGETSKDEAMNFIKKIINNENPKKPLSDDGIARKLSKDYNVDIKRRTVTKYREKLNIGSSRQRKRFN
ncbi:MAG: RNA polymerase factor sigma-54 [Candidatus Muiribacteriota bacterium]